MMQRYVFPVDITSLDAAKALHSDPDFIWLDSNRPDHPQGRYSYIVFRPRARAADMYSEKISGIPPFQGGFVGFRTYEGEDYFKCYHHILSFDHTLNAAWFVVCALSEKEASASYKELMLRVQAAKYSDIFPGYDMDWRSNFSEDSYKRAIAVVIEHILKGDIFQANLTQRFTAEKPNRFNAFVHYLHLRTVNPAPYGAYLNMGDVQISSSSPESFLSIGDGKKIVTRPIKGTDSDAQRLLSSAKDNAENVMIVDLLRNDLSQICEDKSVIVNHLCQVQSFAGLHHLVSEVTGIVRKGVVAKDIMNACFPGGSITGAPKIEAIDILKKIEKGVRGVYCGMIGWIGFDGHMETNIAIRTVIVGKDKISFGVGGGITALSDVDVEYRETLLKADRIFRSFESDPS